MFILFLIGTWLLYSMSWNFFSSVLAQYKLPSLVLRVMHVFLLCIIFKYCTSVDPDTYHCYLVLFTTFCVVSPIILIFKTVQYFKNH